MKLAGMPEWTKELNPESHIGTKDFAKIICIHPKSLSDCIKRGTVPKPDYITNRRFGYGAHYWKLSTLRKWMAKKLAGGK